MAVLLVDSHRVGSFTLSYVYIVRYTTYTIRPNKKIDSLTLLALL